MTTTKTREQWLMAWHSAPPDANSIESLLNYLRYFRDQETREDSGIVKSQMRDFQRTAEQAIARHDEATAADLADLRLL
jgi:hypothetical protein